MRAASRLRSPTVHQNAARPKAAGRRCRIRRRRPRPATASGPRALAVALALVALAAAAPARAQELEPRAYSNAPVGLNFALLGYGYSSGDVAFDESSPIKDASLTVHAAVAAYARTLDVWGRAGKLDVVLP